MMCKKNEKKQSKRSQKSNRDDISKNVLRILTMLEKALIRLLRRFYRARRQYPEFFFQLEKALHQLRAWIQSNRFFFRFRVFQELFGTKMQAVRELITRLTEYCASLIGHENGKDDDKKKKKGKRKGKGSRSHQEYKELCRAIAGMLAHLESFIETSEARQGIIGWAFEQAFQSSFEKQGNQSCKHPVKPSVSQRGEQSYIFAWGDKEGYRAFVTDRKRFRHEVVDKLGEYAHATGHKPCCTDSSKYTMQGFRQHSRKSVMVGGHQEEFAIRMVRCASCGQTFSLLPSFLAREKHFSLDIIGHVVKKSVLFGQSLAAGLEDLNILASGGHSKQTLLDWLDWFGTLHPATLLTRAGIQGNGYFEEDEGFEKEAGLRTYTVVMVEPETLLVWHADYVDHVDEQTLYESFDDFVQRISFKVLGVTKDKWQPSTKALKRVCQALWIEFCHRHCLKKFTQALSKYQEMTGCSQTELTRLYGKFKTVLQSSESSVELKLNLNALDDEGFEHPLLRRRIDELRANAVHYTSHNKRKALRKTTSMVDNFLKIVKRKLRQVQSFRDQKCTERLFRAMANVRNFVPFLSGAKNAQKSPFMLAQGQTYDLPWIQVMNMHNAFLFTAGAC